MVGGPDDRRGSVSLACYQNCGGTSEGRWPVEDVPNEALVGTPPLRFVDRPNNLQQNLQRQNLQESAKTKPS